jgi:hypothetical protein
VSRAAITSALLGVAASIAGCRANQIATTDCEPGHRVFVGCGCQGVGTCESEPDPVLRICDGELLEAECSWDTQLGENDDGGRDCGRCPGVSVVCPPSGRLLVVPRGLYPDEIVTCRWDLRDDGPAE